MDYRFQYRHAGRVHLPLLGLELWPCHVYELYSVDDLCGRLYMGTSHMVADLPEGPLVIVREFKFWQTDPWLVNDPASGETIAVIRFASNVWNSRTPFSATIEFPDGSSYLMHHKIVGKNWFTGTRYDYSTYELHGPGLALSYRGRSRLKRLAALHWEPQFEGFLFGMSKEHLKIAVLGFFLMDTGLHWNDGN